MKMLAWVLWTIAAIWVALASFGAENFQALYGGSSGAQSFLSAFIVAMIPTELRWWPTAVPGVDGCNEVCSPVPPGSRKRHPAFGR